MTRAISFALAVLCLLVFVAVAQRKGGDKVGVKELKIEKIEKDQVSKIEVKLPVKTEPGAGPDAGPRAASEPAHEVALINDDGAWKVYDPKKPERRFAADEAQVNSALGAIGELTAGELIANKAEQHSGLEIDDAHGHHVTIHAADGRKIDVVFGRAVKGGNVTVRGAGGTDVFVAKGRLGALLMKEVGGWRNKSMFDMKPDDIARITTTTASGEHWTLESKPPPAEAAAPDAGPAAAPKPEWALIEPATLPAGFRVDKGQLTRPAALLAGLRAQDFADGATDQQAGFDVAHTVIEVTRKDGKQVVLHVGKEDNDKRNYAKVDGDAQMYLLANYSAKQLDRKLDDFRDLLLLSATAADVERARFRGATGTVVVKRSGGEWTLVEPKRPPPDFDIAQVQNQVASALRMRAVRLAAVSVQQAGVDKATTIIDLTLKGGKKQTVRIGAPVPLTDEEKKAVAADKAPEAREFYATGGADQLVYVIAQHLKKRYDKPAELFKKPQQQPGGMGGMGGAGGGPSGSMHGLENLPPDVRKKLEESIKKGELPGR